jgi:hypothetical protein
VDTFEDVFREDFIVSVGRVGRRQLHRVDLDPYPTGLLKHGLEKRVKEPGLSHEVLQGMEYTGAVGAMLVTDLANINKRVDEVKEEVTTMGEVVDELSTMKREMMELGAELTEARGEAEECQGAMMLMRNSLTDAVRDFQDQKAEWKLHVDLLTEISSGILRRLEAVKREVGPGTVHRPIVVPDSDSGEEGEMVMVIEVWAEEVEASADNTLIGDQIVYELVLIEELAMLTQELACVTQLYVVRLD